MGGDSVAESMSDQGECNGPSGEDGELDRSDIPSTGEDDEEIGENCNEEVPDGAPDITR